MKEWSNLPSLAGLLSYVIMNRMLQNKMQGGESFRSRKMVKRSDNSKDGFREVFYEMKGVGV